MSCRGRTHDFPRTEATLIEDLWIAVGAHRQRMQVHTQGDRENPPLLLIHGSGDADALRTWERQMKYLGRTCFLVVVALLGYGASDRPITPLNARQHATLLHEVVEALNLNHVTVCGLSFGGKVALNMACRYPELVSRLILIDTDYDARELHNGRLAQVTQPTLVIWGEDDAVIPLEAGQRLKATLPQAELHTVSDLTRLPGAEWWWGHAPQYYAADWFNKVVKHWLNRSAQMLERKQA